MLGVSDLVPLATVVARMEADDVVSDRFKKMTGLLRTAQEKATTSAAGKRLAPQVQDFLYASTIMMHAAEASLVDEHTGEPILNKKGEPAKGGFEACKDKRGKASVKWVSADGIMPYKNANSDIFPEFDLIEKHKEWVGKPLCRDHVSSTVDGVRGIIVDTFYDPKFKRVHALFALDRKNYPDLARKVEAGYATSVSMGTAVGRAICSDCFNVATVEAEYCDCMKSKKAYGEVNKDLSPIELSIVVTGADPRAKIKTVLASLHNYANSKEKEFKTMANGLKLSNAEGMQADLDQIDQTIDKVDETADDQTLEDLAKEMRRLNIDGHGELVDILIDRAEKDSSVGKDMVARLLKLLDVGDSDRIQRVKALLDVGAAAARFPTDENVDQGLGKDSAGYSLSEGTPDELSTGDMLPMDNKGPEAVQAFGGFYKQEIEKSADGHKNVASLER